MLLLFFMVPGTRAGTSLPELVTSPASLRFSLALGCKEDKQALRVSQMNRLRRAQVLTLGINQSDSNYFLLKIPMIQDFQPNLLGV